MSWLPLTEADIMAGGMSGFELETFRNLMKRPAGSGGVPPAEADPVDGIITKVTLRVRGFVQSYDKNQLSLDDTLIPDTLIDAAVALFVWELMSRSSGALVDANGTRRDNWKQALAELRDVANGKPPQEIPPLPTDKHIGTFAPSYTGRDAVFGRVQEDGL